MPLPGEPSTPTSDYMETLGVTPSQRLIVQRSAAEFEATGDWVDFDTLADEAALRDDSTFELNDVFSLPQVLGGAWSQEKVSLTGLGLLIAGTAPRATDLMTRITQIAVERRLQLKTEARISRKLLLDNFGWNAEDGARACQLAQMVPGLTGSGTLGDDWELEVFRGTLEYRHVRTTDELLAVLFKQALQRIQAFEQAAARGPFLTSPVESPLDSKPPVVFLSWSGDVSGRVATALQVVLRPRLRNAEVFLSTTSIDPGDDPMRRMLDEGLLKADVLIAVMTAEASGRPWVIWETAAAWARESLVIPIFVDVGPSQVPGPLTIRVQGVRLDARTDLDRAIKAIASRLGVESQSPITDEEYSQLVAAARVEAGAASDLISEPPTDERNVVVEVTGGVVTTSGVLSMPLDGWGMFLQANPASVAERVIVATIRNTSSVRLSIESVTVMYSLGETAGAEVALLGRDDFPSLNPMLPVALETGESTSWLTNLETFRLIESLVHDQGLLIEDFHIDISLGSGEKFASDRYRFEVLPQDAD